MMSHLFPPSLNTAIEDKYREHLLFGYLHYACQPIAAESQKYALTSGELFYQCVYTLDTLKGELPNKQRESCSLFWSEMVEYMRAKEWPTNEPEVTHAVSLIVYSVARCLLLTRNPFYNYPAGLLQAAILHEDAVFSHQIELGFNRAEQLRDMEQLTQWMLLYMESNEKISDEIETLMDQIEQAEKNVLLMKMQSGFPLLTEQCYKEGKEDTVIAELRAACEGTAVVLWKAIRTNEALGYLKALHLSSEKIYGYFTEYFGELPYKERNFRDARNKP